VVAGAALLTLALPGLGPVKWVDGVWSNVVRGSVAPLLPPETRIAVMAVSPATLAPYPYFLPFDRGLLADAVEALAAKGAAALVLDLFMSRPTEPAKDARLKAALEAFPGPVVVSWAEAGQGLEPAEGAYLSAFAANLGKGWPNLAKDAQDNVVRRFLTSYGAPGSVSRETLVTAVARALGIAVPEGMQWLDYRRQPPKGDPSIPIYPLQAAALLPADWIAGKVVMIGADIPGTDRHLVPGHVVGSPKAAVQLPGVVIHAHVLSQLMDGRIVPDLGPAPRAALALAVALAGLAVALVPMAWWARLLGAVLAVVLVAGAGILVVRQGGPDVPFVAPVAGFLAAWGGGTAFVGRRLNREKRFIRQAFAQYVAPAVVAELEAEPGGLKLGGERRRITALFTDVAGFTAFSEHMDPQALGDLLNRYFDGLCDAVVAHDGTIDKFVGDALVALFGAPQARVDHAERALACALAIDAFAEDFRRAEQAKGIPFGITRIGVHTGPATVGNFGGRVRFNYTALGDTVNTASRLEGANKQFGTRLCVSSATAEACGVERFRPIGAIVVKGKDEPVTVYEPAPAAALNGHTASWPGYRMAYGLMERDDPAAQDALADLARQFPDDGLIAFHLRRLQEGGRGITIKLSEK